MLFVIAVGEHVLAQEVETSCRQSADRRWSMTEAWVWNKICGGVPADLSELDPGLFDPGESSAVAFYDRRTITSVFLESLVVGEYSASVTRRGVTIIGAYFPEQIDLRYGSWTWNLALLKSRFEKDILLDGVLSERSISLEGSFAEGRISVVSGAISKDLNLSRSSGLLVDIGSAEIGGALRIVDSEYGQIVMEAADIDGEVDLSLLRAGRIDMRSVTVDGKLWLNRALIEGQGGDDGTLDMESAIVADDVLMVGTVASVVHMKEMRIGGRLDLSKGEFGLLSLRAASVVGEFIAEGVSMRGGPGNSGVGEINFDGIVFGRFEVSGEKGVGDLLRLLRYSRRFHHQPYHELARTLREEGKALMAQRALFKARVHELSMVSWGSDFWRKLALFVGLTFGYGIGLYSLIALGWIVLFGLIGSLLICIYGENRGSGRLVVGRSGYWFSLDYLVPIVRLDQGHYEEVNLRRLFLCDGVRIYFYCHQLLGYGIWFFVVSRVVVGW